MKRFLMLSLVLDAAACFPRCEGPTELALGLRSRASSASVRAALHGCDWRTIDDSRLPPGDRRPRYDWLRVDITNCVHGSPAKHVGLAFFNDRLAKVFLEGVDPQPYLEALRRDGGWTVGSDSSLHRYPATRVWGSTKSYTKNEPYVAWEDACLADEEDAWIEAYG